MNFVEELKPYIDSDGLIGSCPNPTPGTNGNPLVSAGVACKILSGHDVIEIYNLLFDGVMKLKLADDNLNSVPLWNKKARSNDQITHDDIIGLCSVGRFYYKGPVANIPALICWFGSKHWWIMSNTGKIYWDAISKPWHIAFYKMAANKFTMLKPILFLWIALGLIFKGTASDRQLDWLMIKTIQGKSKLIDYAITLWYCGLRTHWISMKWVFAEYYKPDHPFTKYCQE